MAPHLSNILLFVFLFKTQESFIYDELLNSENWKREVASELSIDFLFIFFVLQNV